MDIRKIEKAEHPPRSGLWMELFRELVAFPLYLTAIWALWVFGRRAGVETLIVTAVGAVAIAFGFWLLNRPSSGWKQNLRRLLILAVWALALLIPWRELTKTEQVSRSQAYSPELLASLRSEGTPVFVKLTAAWCITCEANERLAFSTDEVNAALNTYGVMTLKGDWTNNDPLVTQLLTEYGRSGVPLYLWFPAGHRGKGLILPQLLTNSLIIDTLKTSATPQN